jgi:hypothetical protein
MLCVFLNLPAMAKGFSNANRPMCFLVQPHDEPAGELGVAREVVSRALKELARTALSPSPAAEQSSATKMFCAA